MEHGIEKKRGTLLEDNDDEFTAGYGSVTEKLNMTMTGLTVEESELRRLQWCQAELLRLRAAEREIRAQLVDIEARLDALERARKPGNAYIAGE